jgi:hypothetical protein
MSNTITSAFSSSIGFIQLKLSDFGQEEIDFGKILDERFQTLRHLEMLIKNSNCSKILIWII